MAYDSLCDGGVDEPRAELSSDSDGKPREILEPIHRAWLRLAIRGVVALVIAAASFAWPTATLAALFLFISAYILVDGVLALSAAAKLFGSRTNGSPAHGAWLFLAEGALGVVVGIAALIFTPLDARIIAVWLAIWALATGLIEAGIAFRMRRFLFSLPYWAFGAAVSIALGALLILRPTLMATTLVLVFGLYAFAFGLSLLAAAWSLRRIEKAIWPTLRAASAPA